jgi:COP9 signalosome complex subunit 1
VAHTELGEHLAARGDLQGAFKAFVRSRDYGATPAHIVAMCLAVVRVAVEMNNFNHVANYVQKAEGAADTADALTIAKVRSKRGSAVLVARSDA